MLTTMLCWLTLLLLYTTGKAEETVVLVNRAPADFQHFHQVGYYKLYRIKRTWKEAWRRCSESDSHLAIVNSKKEAEVLKEMLHREPNLGEVAYLGFHDLVGDKEYTTVMGTFVNITGYNKWGQSWDSRKKNKVGSCGALNRSGLLVEADCTTKLPFFCEHEFGHGPKRQNLNNHIKSGYNLGSLKLQKSRDRINKFVNDLIG